MEGVLKEMQNDGSSLRDVKKKCGFLNQVCSLSSRILVKMEVLAAHL
jgi:hypothetical protein